MDSLFFPIPLCRQATSYTCGVSALQSILCYYGIETQEDQLSLSLHTNSITGTNFRDILIVSHRYGFKADFYEGRSIDWLKHNLDCYHPVILLLQAWKQDGYDYEDSYVDSHYVVACGYTKETFLFMDPSTLGYFTYLPVQELLKRWHGNDGSGNYIQSAILILPKYKTSPYVLNTSKLLK